MNDIDATLPRIRSHPSLDGVQILDPIQDIQFSLLTPERVDPLGCDTDRFYLPVDVAATLATDVVETPYTVGGWIRDGDGDTVAEISADSTLELGPGSYHVDPTTTGLKLQFAVEGTLVVEPSGERVRFSTGGDRIHVGARSLHEQPAATVTTTDDPADVMAALSTLGSALKTTSCERSFPTLRGHPPLVERGDALSVPDELSPPDTGVTIEVPRSFEYIYPVAPLAYYLGATVRPGTRPRLVTDDWAYDLTGTEGFEATVARVLRQVFLLDCVTRTEGYYDVDLHERRVVEGAVDLDFASLYDRPLVEQLPVYLDVDPGALTDAMPAWKLTADVAPSVEHVSTLPFLANELAVVRSPGSATAAGHADDVTRQAASLFAPDTTEPVRGGGSTRTTRAESSSAGGDDPLVVPASAESIEQAYVGDGVPLGASKMTVDAYYRRLEYEPSADPQISVVVVCNDQQMAEENVVSDIYGTRDWIAFDISFEEQLSTDELRALLRSDAEFLHYIGHVDTDGIRCTDGHLDARDLSEVNVSAFILNACDSYEQGRALVDHGAMAGIVTLTEVNIDLATSVGRTVAHLLNQGFSLAATMALVEEHERIGHHYIAVGDASVSVMRNESGTPYSASVTERDDSTYQLDLFGYPRLDSLPGTMFTPFLPEEDRFYLNSGHMGSFTLTETELRSFLGKQDAPIVSESTLTWGQDFFSPD